LVAAVPPAVDVAAVVAAAAAPAAESAVGAVFVVIPRNGHTRHPRMFCFLAASPKILLRISHVFFGRIAKDSDINAVRFLHHEAYLRDLALCYGQR
jgi:hypothetical protein